MWLPTEFVTASSTGGQWIAQFPANNTRRLVRRISFTGGDNITVTVYIDNDIVDSNPIGKDNSVEYFVALPVDIGRIIKLVWSGASGSAPQVKLWCETDTAL